MRLAERGWWIGKAYKRGLQEDGGLVDPSKRGGMDRGFSKGWHGCSEGFPEGEGNPEEQPCQSEENPVHPDSFTWI